MAFASAPRSETGQHQARHRWLGRQDPRPWSSEGYVAGSRQLGGCVGVHVPHPDSGRNPARGESVSRRRLPGESEFEISSRLRSQENQVTKVPNSPRRPCLNVRNVVGLLFLCLGMTPQVYAEQGAPSENQILTTAWYLWDPFLYPQNVQGLELWTGLDLKLADAIFENAGITISYEEVTTWPELMDDLAQGHRDIAIGSFYTEERELFAYYSIPYRQDFISMYIPRGQKSSYPFRTPDELFQLLRERKTRLGLVKGWSYTSQIDRLLAQPENQSLQVLVEVENDLVELLLNNKIDAYFSGRIPGQTLLWRGGLQDEIQEHPQVLASAPVYVLFSRATIAPEVVERFNQGLNQIKRSGEYGRVVRSYLFPILLSITLETRWFFMVDIIGTIAFSISGILLGRREKYSLFGTFCLAALPAMGGGVIRDIFVGRHPLGVLRTPIYLQAVILTVLISYLLMKVFSWWQARYPGSAIGRVKKFLDLSDHQAGGRIVQIFDALGLSAFAIIGVVVAVEAQAEPLWLWGPFMAVLTGAGGGIVRDVVRSEPEIETLKGEFYAEVALLWGFIFSIYLMWTTRRLDPNEILIAVIVILFGSFLTRLAVIRFKIKGLLF